MMEFRTRSRRTPGGELRIWLGRPTSRKDREEKERIRGSLRALARAGDWDTLDRVRSGDLTPEQVHAAYTQRGIEGYLEALRSARAVPTLEERFLEFLGGVENPKTREAYRTAGRRIMEHLGHQTPIDQVTAHDVNEMIQGWSGKYAAGYRAKIITVGSSYFTWLREWDRSEAQKSGHRLLLDENPFRAAKAVPTPTTRHRFLERDEYALLRDHAPPSIRAMYATSVWAGLRPGELLHLRPEDVELPRRIRIQPQPGWSPKGWPKSERSVRDIPIHRTELLPILEEHQAVHAGTERFFVNPRTGEPWTYQSWRAQVRRDVEGVGLTFGSKHPRGITPHTFRHTLASWMARADIQMVKIARLLGNTVAVATAHYTHLLPTDLDETINRL